MCRFKEKGEVNHLAVITNVPRSERLPALSKIYGNDKIAAVLSKSITKALNNLNLRVGMNPEQVAELSYALIETSEEDQLAIQDILLFLEGLPKAKYGKIYDRMDMPTFFEMLEVYREKRHKEYMELKYEQEAQYKASGDTTRMSTDDRDGMREALKNYLITK